MVKVSVIIPLYNSEKYIGNTIYHLSRQTYKHLEIIIVDDSSTDDGFKIAKEFESNIIKVIQQPNAGAAVARNTGLAHATGDYIQFMDADDYLSADKIEKQVVALNGSPDKVAVCNYLNFVDDTQISELKYNHEQDSFIYSTDDPVDFLLNLYGAYSQSNFIQTNCWLVPRKLIDKVGGWRNYRCPDDDGEFFARILLASSGIVSTPEVYNYYRRSFGTAVLSQNRQHKYLQNTLLTIDLKHTYLSKYTSGLQLDQAMARQYLNFAVSTYLHNKNLSNIAYRRYRNIGVKVEPPKIGGRVIEIVKKLIGWRLALQIKAFVV